MKKLYLIIVFLTIIFSVTFIYDFTLYENTYFELVNVQDIVCYLVSRNGGITNSIKEMLNMKNINIEYEKSSDINGAAFEFTLCKRIKYLLISNDKYVKLNLVVILGY